MLLLSLALAEPVEPTDALLDDIASGRVMFSPDFQWMGHASYYSSEPDPGGWRGPGVHLSDGSDVRIEDCDAFYESLRSRAAARTWGPYTVELGRLRAGDVVLIDEASGCGRVAEDQGYDTRILTLRSIVGPLVSYTSGWSGMGAGGPPYHGQRLVTVDVWGQPAPPLSAWVDEAELLRALAVDPYLRRERPDLTEGDGLRDFETFSHELHVSGYAFHAWDPDNDRVAVRLGVLPYGGCGLCPNVEDELGLWLTPNEALRHWLRTGEGFLGDDRSVVGRDLRIPRSE